LKTWTSRKDQGNKCPGLKAKRYSVVKEQSGKSQPPRSGLVQQVSSENYFSFTVIRELFRIYWIIRK
jgi:hypothetical protein